MTLTTFPPNVQDVETPVHAPARSPVTDAGARRSSRPRVLVVTDDPSSLREATAAMTRWAWPSASPRSDSRASGAGPPAGESVWIQPKWRSPT